MRMFTIAGEKNESKQGCGHVAVNTSQLGPVTSVADGAAGALVYALITSAAARYARDDISSQAGCLGLTSPLALIPVALIRMYCELILCYCYSPL